MQEDLLSHSKFVESRLHVQNQVLDNCLSTIKHESMYYPSRIRQLVSSPEVDIQQLDELTTYYKQMYTLLSGQAERQTSNKGQQRGRVAWANVLQEAARTFAKQSRKAGLAAELSVQEDASPAALQGIIIRADEDMLNELFSQLAKYLLSAFPMARGFHLSYDVSEEQLRVRVESDALHYSEQEAHNLFYPDAQRIPLLIVKQIIRDTDAMNNNPGLRLVAEPDCIWFTLPLESEQQ